MRVAIVFRGSHTHFRLSEFQAACEYVGYDLLPFDQATIDRFNTRPQSPILIHEFPDEATALRILEHTSLVNEMLEIWCQCESQAQLPEAVHSIDLALVEPYNMKSFKMTHKGYGCKFPIKETLALYNRMPYIGQIMKGKVDLRKPEVELQILEDWWSRIPVEDLPADQQIQEPWCEGVYVGRVIGRRRDKECGVTVLDLKKRNFLGPTSMDAHYALIMGNMGHSYKGSLVYDPFVGTGSVLVSCAYLGAKVMGSDRDPRVWNLGARLAAPTHIAGGNILSMFTSYGLDTPELFRNDMAQTMLRCNPEVGLFDAIVTDPPYAVRAGARKVGISKRALERHGNNYVYNPENHPTEEAHIPMSVPYPLNELLIDLLNVAARTLKVGGRLVYWYPSHVDTYDESKIPTHPCLQLRHNDRQPLSAGDVRHLVTMIKTRAPVPGECAEVAGWDPDAPVQDESDED